MLPPTLRISTMATFDGFAGFRTSVGNGTRRRLPSCRPARVALLALFPFTDAVSAETWRDCLRL